MQLLHSIHAGLLRLAAALAIVVGLAVGLAGCAGQSKSDPRRSNSAGAQELSAAQQLHALATWEAEFIKKGQPPEVASIDPAIVPPGVEPDVLAPRSAHDVQARLSLAEAFAQIEQSQSIHVGAPAPAAVDDDTRGAALKHYAKGRAAALANRNLQAIIEFQKARQLDPGSPQILRELAHVYEAENQLGQAVEIYERLIQLDPGNLEARFTLGLSAANRRDFNRAVALIGSVRLHGQSFDHDPAADIIADFTLGWSLRELGYDRASIEAARRGLEFPEAIAGMTSYAARLGSVFRQRGETWRAIGDAHCRLGEYENALEAYRTAAALPSGDPGALHPRVIYANLCLGRPAAAQLELYLALDHAGRSHATGRDLASYRPVSEAVAERDIRLCAFLRKHAGDVRILAQAIGDLSRANPDHSGYVRAAASLLPAHQASQRLKEFVSRRPRDLDAVSQLLAWLATEDQSLAVDFAVALATDHPDLADEFTDRLLIAVWRPSRVLAALNALESTEARHRIEVRTLLKAGALGEAWSTCVQARERFVDSTPLLVQQLQIAAALREPMLVRELVRQMGEVRDARVQVALSQAHRAAGELEQALAAAQAAVDIDENDPQAAIELARAAFALASAYSADQSLHHAALSKIDRAAELARLAIALEPESDGGYELLTLVYGQGGLRADSGLFRETLQSLRNANPESPLLVRLMAQEAMLQRRFEQALERLVNLYDNNPSDVQSLGLAVSAWEHWGRLDVARQWLDERLRQRPGDPALVEQWVIVALKQNQQDQAIDRLRDLLEEDPDDLPTRRLLENVYRVGGQLESAFELGERRLLARPVGVRRELELAALYAGVRRWPQAVERLRWLNDNAAHASLDELAGAVRIAGGMDRLEEARDPLTLQLAQTTIHRFPAAPLQVYGWALRAMARTKAPDDQFDALARQALEQSQGAASPNDQGVTGWLELAQGLVDDGQPAAAGRVLRLRLFAEAPIEPVWRAAVFQAILAADAASELAAVAGGAGHAPASTHVEQSIQLIRSIMLRDSLRAGLIEQDDPKTVAGLMYEANLFYALANATFGSTRLLREAIALDPDHAGALNDLGYRRLEDGHSDAETIEMIERAYALNPEEPHILDTIGWLRYKQGRFEDETAPGEGGEQTTIPGAINLIQQSASASRDQPSPEVLDHLGDAHWRAGDRQAAIDSWKKAVGVIEDSAFRQQIIQGAMQLQRQGWRLVVFDAQDMFERQYGSILWRMRQKLTAAEHGEEPAVAPTFAESRGLP